MTKCTKCGKSVRIVGDTICTDCKSEAWDKICAEMLDKYEPLRTFCQTWAISCKAPKEVFIGQTCKMVQEILLKRLEEVFQANGIELLQSMSSTLEEDTLLALRFLYYCKAYSAIPDDRYDQAERAFLARPEVEDSLLMNPGSDNPEDYPEAARALGFYLMLISERRRRS